MSGRWDYRVVRTSKRANEVEFTIHEVYYGEDDSIVAWAGAGSGAFGETEAELGRDLQHMLEALSKPVLHHDDMPWAAS